MAFASNEDSKNFFKFLDIYYDHSEICGNERVIDWLEARGSDPDFWHDTATHWSWDAGVEVLHWIARQPTCEMATASWILIEGGSGGYLYRSAVEYDSSDLPIYEMLKDIAERWRAGFYTSSRLGFTRQQFMDFQRSAALFCQERARIGSPPVWELPLNAFGPFTGPAAISAGDAVFDAGKLRMTMQHFTETYDGPLELPKVYAA